MDEFTRQANASLNQFLPYHVCEVVTSHLPGLFLNDHKQLFKNCIDQVNYHKKQQHYLLYGDGVTNRPTSIFNRYILEKNRQKSNLDTTRSRRGVNY